MPDTVALTLTDTLDRLAERGTRFLGCRVPVMGGAMSWVSERHLVSAISDAGGFGVIAAGSMTPALLAAEIVATRARTRAPFGVNLITFHPDIDALVGVCLDHGVGHLVLAGGIPPAALLRRVVAGARAICFASALPIAQRLVRMGADALVIEGSEAGGHIGPVSLAVLAQEILPVVRDVPVFVAGGLGRGEAITAFLQMGAAGAQIGTRFAAATESIAHPRFKQAFFHARARDAMPSIQLDPAFPVMPVRGLVNRGTARFVEHQAVMAAAVRNGSLTREAAQLQIEHFWAGGLRRAVLDGDVEDGSVMAGQSVGMVTHEQPVAEIIAELMAQARAALHPPALHPPALHPPALHNMGP